MNANELINDIEKLLDDEVKTPWDLMMTIDEISNRIKAIRERITDYRDQGDQSSNHGAACTCPTCTVYLRHGRGKEEKQ